MTVTTRLPALTLRSLDATWSRERWEKLPDDGNRYEIIDGVLYMTTAPSAFHQWIIRQLFLALYGPIDQAGVGLTFWAPIGVFMPHCDPVQPDLVVVRTEELAIIHERRIHGVPALMVEVLSPSNPEQDTEVKRAAYARAGVAEYWIVRPSTRDVVVCSDPDSERGDYRRADLIAPDGYLDSPTLPVRFSVAQLFTGAPDTTL